MRKSFWTLAPCVLCLGALVALVSNLLRDFACFEGFIFFKKINGFKIQVKTQTTYYLLGVTWMHLFCEGAMKFVKTHDQLVWRFVLNGWVWTRCRSQEYIVVLEHSMQTAWTWTHDCANNPTSCPHGCVCNRFYTTLLIHTVYSVSLFLALQLGCFSTSCSKQFDEINNY
jgi:hypothetical protein